MKDEDKPATVEFKIMASIHTKERVLSTLEQDGSRRWIKPRLSQGRYLYYRRIMAYVLIAIFMLIPFIKLKGKPLILLDVVHREFTILGATFLPTDTVLLTLFILCVFVGIFLITALFGRIWCGWACPQTVYMEFVFRPLERLFDRYHQEGEVQRQTIKYILYFILSLVLAHIFLAYFVGVDNLFRWIQRSPFEHPSSFLIMMFTTGLMMFDFCYFREQMCILACPYGRLQSVLLDAHSLIVSYDPNRGEPRGKLKRFISADANIPDRGDCVDCKMCVTTCPTGIDIREGLQMECIGCAQCIDACDRVMAKIRKPKGLIRYSSTAAMKGDHWKLFRPRMMFYPTLLMLFVLLFGFVLHGKQNADVTLLRNLGNPYTIMKDGSISNSIRLKIVNRGSASAAYQIGVVSNSSVEMIIEENPFKVEDGQSRTVSLLLGAPRSIFSNGKYHLKIRISDGEGFQEEISYHMLGPFTLGDEL